MKKQLTTFLSKPKLVTSLGAVIALGVGAVIYPMIGVAPKVDVSLQNDSIKSSIVSGDNVDLSFSKAGRIESVEVKNGDTVKKGEVLAKLSAPDALGLVNQAKGALTLAQAQYASLDVTYANTKKQQDVIVKNAYNTLLNTAPQAVANDTEGDHTTITYPLPTISGNYLLGKEGVITIKTVSETRGVSFIASGVAIGENIIIPNTPTPIGNSGLSITFADGLVAGLQWTISLPNTRNADYAANKNAYDLAVANREKVLADLATSLGSNGNSSVAKAQIDAAQGAYDAALGAYQNNLVISPVDGVVNFVDDNVKPGQSVVAGKTVISITAK